MECIEESYIFLPITKGDIALPQLGIILHHPNGNGNEVIIDYVNQMIPSTLHVEVSLHHCAQGVLSYFFFLQACS